MTPFDAVLALAFATLVAFQAWLTLRVARSHVYERAQKIRQAQLIWLVPVIGAGLVYSVMRDDEAAARAADQYVAKSLAKAKTDAKTDAKTVTKTVTKTSSKRGAAKSKRSA